MHSIKQIVVVKDILHNIESILTPFLDKKGIELVELRVIGNGKNQTLKVVVWSKENFDMGAVSGISRHVSDLLDAEDIIPGFYNLEVTSPGLDRKLTNCEDFRRVEGERVRFTLVDGIVKIGVVVSSIDGKIVIENENETEELNLKDIVKGKIEIEF
ncbi:hypothetical protein KAH81_01370 [bacterium]|nr:hypothetical protein [bacterium]